MAFDQILSLMLAAGSPVAAASEPTPFPPALSAFYPDGTVPAGDYRWFEGNFPGASEDAQHRFVDALQFNEQCQQRSRDSVKAKMQLLGHAFDPGLNDYAAPAACRQFAPIYVPQGTTLAQFNLALDKVRPYALGIIRSVELVEQQVIDRDDLAQQLRTRPLGEQALRFAWIESQRREGATAGYDALERLIHEGILTRALSSRDQDNSAWLARILAVEGWPAQSKVGASASHAAWLLAQHADNDPALQLTALRLMAPLVKQGEADETSFAMLTDRIELKLSGKQTYGTQWTCRAGKREPLEFTQSTAETDRMRAEMKLDSLAQNAARLEALYGPCSRDTK